MVAQEEDRILAAPDVNRDLGYPIVVGDDLHGTVGAFVREWDARTIVVSDADPHVLAIARRIAGRSVNVPVLPFALGERRKRLTIYERVLDALFDAGADRQTLVVGVGGGVAADLFGFAAATYMRGIAYAHVATSLVAMADAAIGGKTAVDLRGGKNLAGVFADPRAVFCAARALRTLPLRSLREGLAEIVKAGIIEGHDLFEALETLAPHPFFRWPWETVIALAVKVKTAIVADDRREAGVRETLNLGHTFAHGIELASNYRVTHGAAVALGLRAAGLLALRTGRWGNRDHLRVLALLTMLGMPLRTGLDPEAMFAAMQGDKKKRGGRLRFVLPRVIGDVEYGVACSDFQVRTVLAQLTRPPEATELRRR